MEEYKYFDELSGPPNGGKHTLIGRLIRRFFILGHRDVDSLQADRDIPAGLAQPTKHFDREMYVLSKIVNLIIYAQNVLRANFFLVHRGPYDAIAWFRALVIAGLISKKEAAPGISYAKANIYRINRVVLVKVPVDVSLL